MVNQAPQKRVLEKRKSVCIPFNGPRSTLGAELRPLMIWIYHNYRYRLSEVTVCWQQRDTTELVVEEDQIKTAEFRLDLDRHLPYDVEQKLPENAQVKDLPEETIVCRTFAGPLEEVTIQSLEWMKEMESTTCLAPGYRQRFAKFGSEESPNWEIEVQLLPG